MGRSALSTGDEKERLSRRKVLAALPLLALPLSAGAAAREEILLVDGWVLARSDLAKLKP